MHFKEPRGDAQHQSSKVAGSAASVADGRTCMEGKSCSTGSRLQPGTGQGASATTATAQADMPKEHVGCTPRNTQSLCQQPASQHQECWAWSAGTNWDEAGAKGRTGQEVFFGLPQHFRVFPKFNYITKPLEGELWLPLP